MISEDVNIFQCNAEAKQIQTRVKHEFWRETVLAWQELVHKEIRTTGEILNEVIWLNRNINAEKNPGIRPKACIGKGIVKVNDLYDSNKRRMYSANELAVKFGLHRLFCQSLIRTIPQSRRKLLNEQERMITVENTRTQELLRTKKIVSWAYLDFIRKTEIRPIACEKWQGELKLPGTHNWDMLFNRTYIVSDDRKLGYSFSACIGSYRQTSARICMGLSKQINVDIVQCTKNP